MKNKKEGNGLSKLESQELMIALPEELQRLINRFPENRRRTVNKIIDKDQYFSLIYNLKNNKIDIENKSDLLYSTIPHDVSRKYIQTAAIVYKKNPQYVDDFIELHRPILEIYFKQAISVIKGSKYRIKKSELDSAYSDIFKDPLFEIQIMGRLISHDELGPLSASIERKFLYYYNKKTGISGYVWQYLKYVEKITNNYPIITDAVNFNFYNQINKQLLSGSIDDSSLNPPVAKLGNNPIILKQDNLNIKPFLKSEYGEILDINNKTYIAQSIYPKLLKDFFPNVLPIENNNQINVVSDIHAEDKIPFINKNFNIIAGDIADNISVTDPNIKGIMVIGNWDININISDLPSENLSPSGHVFRYHKVKNKLQKKFPKMKVLNNESLEYQGVRYVGLTLPLPPGDDLARIEYQDFIYHNLKKILKDDVSTPTVIISHAPLFNELSLLSSTSTKYDENNVCIDSRIKDLFHKFNIIGVIHGHHHIRATSGRKKEVIFANKQIFIICSIYSPLNTGYDLEKVLAHLQLIK